MYTRPEVDDVSALRRRAAGLAALVEVSGTLAATLDLDQILQATTDGVCRLAGFDTAAVYLLAGASLRLGATAPALPPDFPEPLRLAPLADHPHIARAIATAAPVVLRDAREATLTAAEQAAVEQRGLRTLLYVPMIAGVKAVGVLIVAAGGEPRPLGLDEVDLCRALANLAAMATENARLYQAGLANTAALERQAAEARRADAERLELERQLLHAQKLESLGVLAGGIAHDFNNLLQAMLGNLSLALPELAPGSPVHEAVEHAAQAARRATDLTRQLLAYSGKGRFVIRPVDLSALVRENAHLFRAGVPHTCSIALRLSEDLSPVEADVGQVQQVIMNLLTNAAEAIGERPGVVTITTSRHAGGAGAVAGSRVAVAEPCEAYVALEVSDTGGGMAPDTLARLFDPFFSTKGVGRGLGLSALLGIVRGHRGALFVDSAPGRGTAVRVLFPAMVSGVSRAAPASAPPAGHASPGPTGASGAVLVVDDEEVVRRACLRMLRALGRPVLSAGGGQEAVEVLRAHPGQIGAAIVDLSMPGMDGLATLEALRALEPALPVLLTSGFDEQALLGRGAQGRAAGFLQKPYSLDELRAAVARLLPG